MSSKYHYPTRDEFAKRLAGKSIPKSITTVCAVLTLIGAGLFIYGAFTGVERAWYALHFNWLFFASVASAGVTFAAVQRITTARWSRPVVRFAEGFVAFMPVAFLLLLLILFPGRSHIFAWAGREAITVAEKATYLDPTFFLTRGILIFALLTLLQLWFVYNSVRLDVAVMDEQGSSWAAGIRKRMRDGFGNERRELHNQHSIQGKIAVVTVIVFAFGWVVMSWDYAMTLSLHFQQTMYGWIEFMSAWLGMIVLLSLLAMWWRKHLDMPDVVTMDQFWDLGKLSFAFVAFFGYISFGQYLVIWFGNMPEETHFYRLRLIGAWKPVTLLIPVLAFILPFFGLMSKAAKVYLPTFVFFALSTLVGLWLHRYIEVYPSIIGETSTLPFGLWEIGIGLGMLGLFGLCYAAFMNAFPVLRVFMMTSPYKDEVQIPVDPRTMEPLPAHE